ncbi:hypothetical protein HAX54_007006 [Datura stramonium]|uniref:Uncharacterized protein n=1 Tax=Datura stramonium TaxID=4076 RepID=A0ABS8RUT7_DATST|nr:hypothetical protein [Datura stramonium]
MHLNVGHLGRQSATHWKNTDVTSRTVAGSLTLSSAPEIQSQSTTHPEKRRCKARTTVDRRSQIRTSVSPVGAQVGMVFPQATDLHWRFFCFVDLRCP